MRQSPFATLHLTPTLADSFAAVARQPTMRHWALVPDRDIEDQLQRAASPEVMVQWIGLARLVMSTLPGRGWQSISEAQSQRLLQQCLDTLAEAGRLPTLSPVIRKAGLLAKVLEWLGEMQAQAITPADALQHSGTELEAELALIYAEYDGFLRTRQRADDDGLLWRTLELLEADPTLFAQPIHLSVVGFDQFSPVRLRLLEQLAARVRSVDIYLVYDQERVSAGADEANSLALARLTATLRDLQAVFPTPPLWTATTAHTAQPAPLAHLRRTLFEAVPPSPLDASAVIEMVVAPTREAEVRAALRRIHTLLVDGADPTEIGFVAPHAASYQRIVQAVAADYGISVQLKQPLTANAAVTTLLNLLSLAPDFPWRATLDVLRSPYLVNMPFQAEDVATIDRLTRERPVIAGVDQWTYALTPPTLDSSLNYEADDDLGSPPLIRRLDPDYVVALRDNLRGFFETLTPPRFGRPREFVQWLTTQLAVYFPLLEETDELLFHRDEIAFKELRGCLDRLSESFEFLGPPRRMAWASYRADLVALLAGSWYTPNPDPAAVAFEQIDAARRRVVDHLIVLGLNEGEFPRLPTPDLFYSAADRASSPLPLRQPVPGDDYSLWWQAISNCRQTLTLLRPRLDSKGTPTLPSACWDAVLAQFPSLPVTVIPLEEKPDSTTALGVAEQAVAWASAPPGVGPTIVRANPALRPLIKNVARVTTVLRRRADKSQPPAAYEGVITAPDLRAWLSARYAPERVTWSLSRLQRYASCPYGFFAEIVLALEPLQDPPEGLTPIQKGQILHAVLELLYGWMRQEGLHPCQGDSARIASRLDALCDEIFERAPARYQFRPGPLWPYQQRELRQHLHAFLQEECRAEAGHTPVLQEMLFSKEKQTAVTLRADGIEFTLMGVIDRLDLDAQSRAHIVDYKSGNYRYSEADIVAGRALQTALYALAAEQSGYRVASSRYLHILKPDKSKMESGALSFDGAVAENPIVQAALEQTAHFTQAIREGQFPAAPSSEELSCRPNCALAAICRVTRESLAKKAFLH